MTKRIFQIKPGLASLVYVSELTNPGIGGPYDHAAIFLSEERGIVCGRRDTRLASYGWPQAVQDSLTAHFKHVFSLRHEDWREPGPSPRAVYCDALKPWNVEVDE